MARPAVLVRFALIILTTVGVAWMHSFGHSFTHASTSHTAVAHDSAAHDHREQHFDAATTVAVPGPAAVVARAPICEAGCPDGMGMDPFAVCLAILSSLGLLLLLAAAWLTSIRARLTAWRSALAWWPAGRGPPAFDFGLRLTRLSVLRI
jgi:predicted cobalt transporter CbtA